MKKILTAFIICGITLHATPVTMNNTGLITKLEKFTPVCTYYSQVIKNSKTINRMCRTYSHDLNNVLTMGYQLDRSITPQKHTHLYHGKMHTCTEQSHTDRTYNPVLLKKYSTAFRRLDKLRNQIIEAIEKEKSRARRSYDVEYHEKLIRQDIIPLYHSDYIFISEHRDVYANANNPRYIKMLKDKKEELLSDKQRKYLAEQRSKMERQKDADQAKWMEMCGYDMSPERHFSKKGGKLIGEISGSDSNGYFVKSINGNFGTTYYVAGGPLHTGGYLLSPVYVISKGEKISTTLTNSRGVKTKGTALVVYYNDSCLR